MNDVSRMLIIAGLVFVFAGLLWHFSGGKIPLGRLPGDIRIETGNSKVYIPIVSCLVVSLVLSLIAYLFRR